MKTEHCRTCSEPVIWATTAAGKAMPVDAEPRSDGNLDLIEGDPVPQVRVIPAHTPTMTGLRYVSHFATCSHAAEHRKRKG